MSRSAYIHPTHRSLKTEQIGPSSHKNEFQKGVLVGNWYEDRIPPPSHEELPFYAETTRDVEFGAKCTESRRMERAADLPRELLFGHTSSTIRDKDAIPAKPLPVLKAADLKRQTWKNDLDPDKETFTTTKKSLVDSVGDHVMRDKQVLHDTCIKTGIAFSSTFVNDHKQMGLRIPSPSATTTAK